MSNEFESTVEFTEAEQAAMADNIKFPSNVTVTDEATKKVLQTATVEKTQPHYLKPTDISGKIKFQTVDDVLKWAQIMLKDDMVPKGYTTPGQVIAAVQMGAELGLTGFQALKSLAPDIDGSPKLHTDGPLAVVQRLNLIEDIQEWFFDKEGKRIDLELTPLAAVFGATCKIKRRGYETWHVSSYDLGLAKRAKLYPGTKRDGTFVVKMPWNAYTEIMLQRRARAIGLLGRFADALCGTAIAEYHDHNERDVTTNENTRSENLTEKLLRDQDDEV